MSVPPPVDAPPHGSSGAGSSVAGTAVGRLRAWFLAIVALVLLGLAFRAMAVVIVPVITALGLALVVAPVRHAIVARMPRGLRWMGTFAAMGVIVLALLAFLGGLWIALRQVIATFPDVAERVRELLGGGSGAEGWLGDALGLLAEAAEMLSDRLVDFASGMATGLLDQASGAMIALVLVFFLTLLALLEGPRWSRAFRASATGPVQDRWLGALDVIGTRLRAYLLTRAIMGAVTASAYVAWLAVFGLDLLLAWGLLAFLLGFLPVVGAIISAMLPLAYALLTRDPGTVLLIAAGLVVIEQVIGNYLDPMIEGRRVAVSPLVVLVALLFWGWIWGIAGALLAVPLTIVMMVVASRIDTLRPLALFLSNQPDMEGLDEVTQADE